MDPHAGQKVLYNKNTFNSRLDRQISGLYYEAGFAIYYSFMKYNAALSARFSMFVMGQMLLTPSLSRERALSRTEIHALVR